MWPGAVPFSDIFPQAIGAEIRIRVRGGDCSIVVRCRLTSRRGDGRDIRYSACRETLLVTEGGPSVSSPVRELLQGNGFTPFPIQPFGFAAIFRGSKRACAVTVASTGEPVRAMGMTGR